MRRSTFASFVIALTLCVPPNRAPAQDAVMDAAQLCPASANAFIQIDNLAAARAAFADDPLVELVRQQAWQGRDPKPWRDLQTMLDMDGDQIIDRYMGRSVVMVGEGIGDHKPWLMLSRVEPADTRILVAKLGLEYVKQINGFDAYKTADNAARMAFGRGWMLVADRKFEDVAVEFLEKAGQGPSLADDEDFRAALAKMPAERSAVLFARDPDKDETHVLAAVRQQRDVSLHYAGKSDEYREMLSLRGDAKSLEFGPLPADTLAAMTVNLFDPNPEPNPFIDRLLAPKTFNADVLPKLAAPLVAFVGEVKGSQLDPDPGLNVPVLGMAIKLKDPSVAADLTRVFDGLMLLANVATVQWQTSPILVTDASHRSTSFRVAGVGVPLGERAGRPELGAIRLTYGRVGDWYVVCSQDEFFKRCIDAQADPGSALASSAYFKASGLHDVPGPIASAYFRAGMVGRHMQSWIDHWRQVRPQVIASAEGQPGTPEARAVKGVMLLSEVLGHFQSVSMQTHAMPDGEVRARLNITRE